MSVLNGVPSVTHTVFDGSSPLSDEEDVKDPHCLYCQDVEFVPGQARTRRGFGQAFIPQSDSVATGVAVSTFINWLESVFNRLIYFAPAVSSGSVIQRDLNTSVETSIYTGLSTTLGCAYCTAGYWILIAFFKSHSTTKNVIGAANAIAWDGAIATKLFPRPLVSTDMTSGGGFGTGVNAGFAYTEPSAGLVTVGKHYFGIILTSTAGAENPPGPGNSTTGSFLYSIAPYFTSAGGKNLVIQVRATWPVGAAYAQLIMTPVTNPAAWYKVPGQINGVPSGTTFTITFTVDLSDVTLTGTSDADVVAAGYFSILAQLPDGTGPITPALVASFNNRVVYSAQDLAPDGVSLTSTMFISEISKPQWITRQYHQIYLPEFLPISAFFVNGNILYVLGPQWTFAYGDNGLYPVQWASPRTVSRSIGTTFPYGVANNSTLNYAWVADSSGLYQMQGGFYPALPASYYQTPDWLQINFSAPSNTLFVVEDPNRRMVLVAAPVGAAQTTTNKILAWDYTDGVTPDKIKYCGMWSIKAGAYNIGGIGVVYNQSKACKELWMARQNLATPPLVTNFLRQKYAPADATDNYQSAIYDDDGIGIDARYRFGPLAPMDTGPTTSIAASARIRGNGTATLTAYSMDQSAPLTLSPITNMVAKPARWFMRFFDKQSESISLEVGNTVVAGNFWVVAAIKYWYNRWMEMR